MHSTNYIDITRFLSARGWYSSINRSIVSPCSNEKALSARTYMGPCRSLTHLWCWDTDSSLFVLLVPSNSPSCHQPCVDCRKFRANSFDTERHPLIIYQHSFVWLERKDLEQNPHFECKPILQLSEPSSWSDFFESLFSLRFLCALSNTLLHSGQRIPLNKRAPAAELRSVDSQWG